MANAEAGYLAIDMVQKTASVVAAVRVNLMWGGEHYVRASIVAPRGERSDHVTDQSK